MPEQKRVDGLTSSHVALYSMVYIDSHNVHTFFFCHFEMSSQSSWFLETGFK